MERVPLISPFAYTGILIVYDFIFSNTIFIFLTSTLKDSEKTKGSLRL